MSLDLTPLKKTDCLDVQNIFNEKTTIGLLGGFHMLESIKQQVKPNGVSGWIARENGEAIGAFQIGGRPQSQILKYGEVSVLPAFRRRRIGTTMYIAATMQGILEGRRLYSDTIVGDNEIQHKLLPSIGATKAGVLRHKTASAKDIVLYDYDLIDTDFDGMLSRINRDAKIYLHNGPYQFDLYAKNMDILKKHLPSQIARMDRFKDLVLACPQIVVMAQEVVRGVKNTVQPELLKTEDSVV